MYFCVGGTFILIISDVLEGEPQTCNVENAATRWSN
jgi:hypothetical protein